MEAFLIMQRAADMALKSLGLWSSTTSDRFGDQEYALESQTVLELSIRIQTFRHVLSTVHASAASSASTGAGNTVALAYSSASGALPVAACLGQLLKEEGSSWGALASGAMPKKWTLLKHLLKLPECVSRAAYSLSFAHELWSL